MKFNQISKELLQVVQSFVQAGQGEEAVFISLNKEQNTFRYVLKYDNNYDCYEGYITEYAKEKYTFGSLWRKRLCRNKSMVWCNEI